jgi:hypothetical protein
LTARRILYPLTAAIILGYFLYFVWPSLRMYFDSDDMYALYFAWSKPWSQVIHENLFFWQGGFRPLGAFFYRGLFVAFGYNPLPFRIAELAFGLIDLGVCFWIVKEISESLRVAAVATLLFAFHSRMIEVWYRTTIIFDVLCFLFVWLAAGVYIQARKGGGKLGVGRAIAILVLYFFAMDSKEMAVVLPLLLLSYELLFNPVRLKASLRSRPLALIAIMGVMTVAYMHGKLFGPDLMLADAYYTPEYSLARFQHNWNVYIGDLLVLKREPAGWFALAILAGLLAGALLARSRKLIFAWIVLFFGLLPVTFVPQRGGYVMYISYVGWVLYAGIVLIRLEDLITRSRPQYRTALACVIFALVGWRVGKAHLHSVRTEPRPWLYESPAMIRGMAEQLPAMHPSFPKSTRILFQEDAFTTGEWTPLFVMRLLYHDRGLIVDRIKSATAKPADWAQYTSPDHTHYDYVFTWENGNYRQVTPVVSGRLGLTR